MGTLCRKNDGSGEFSASLTSNFLPGTCCKRRIKHDTREPGLFKEEFGCTEMICLCSETYCCFDKCRNKTKISSKSFTKRTLEEMGAGTLEK